MQRKKRYEFLVLSRPVAGREDEFNEWYTNTHLKDVVSVPGFVGAKRFKLLESACSAVVLPQWQYAAIYEIEGEDPKPILEEMYSRANGPQMLISSALDHPSVGTFLMTQIAAHEKIDAA